MTKYAVSAFGFYKEFTNKRKRRLALRKSSTTSLTASLRKLIIPQKATTPKALKFLQNNFKKHLTKD